MEAWMIPSFLKSKLNKNVSSPVRTGAIFALIKAPPMQGNTHNDYLNPKGCIPQP